MHILHFYKNALPESIGGVEQTIDQIARGTSKLGVSNTVLSLSDNPHPSTYRFHGYDLVTTKRDFEIKSTSFSWQSLDIFKKLSQRADLIHFHFPWPFADLLNWYLKPKKPLVVTYHSDIVRQNLLLKIYNPLKNSFLNSADSIVATSPNYLDTSCVLNSFKDKAIVIPIGLDLDSYPKPNLLKIQYFKTLFGDRFFLFIGSLRYYKGLISLIEAAKSFTYPVVIAGSGKLEFKLKALATKYHLKNIYFLGKVSEEDKCALLYASYSIVFPSNLRSEAFGVALLEGAMFKKPLISCEIGTGTTYININNLTGLVVPPSDPIELSRAMTWLWNNPSQATKMGEQAFTRFNDLFTSEKMCKSYFDLYQNLLFR